jgi:hypothetical protein
MGLLVLFFLCRSGQVNASRERETFLDKQTGNHWEIGTGRDKKWVLNKNRNQDEAEKWNDD